MGVDDSRHTLQIMRQLARKRIVALLSGPEIRISIGAG
jgi:hypothetical protein